MAGSLATFALVAEQFPLVPVPPAANPAAAIALPGLLDGQDRHQVPPPHHRNAALPQPVLITGQGPLIGY